MPTATCSSAPRRRSASPAAPATPSRRCAACASSRAATLVVKRGPMGCVVFEGAIPDDIEAGLQGPGFPVEVFNILGAGDAFMAGFLRGWLESEPLADCCAYANACGALVVSRHGCAPAMPSWTELTHFLAHGSPERALRDDAALEHLHRATTRLTDWPELAVFAFDHRSSSKSSPEAAPTPRARIARFKALLAEGARRGAESAAAPAAPRRSARSSTIATARRRCRPSPAPAPGSPGRSSCPGRGRWPSRSARPGAGAARLADRARRQVPGQLPPGRSGRAARGAARAAAGIAARLHRHRPRAAGGSDPAARDRARRRHPGARPGPDLRRRRAARLVEAAAAGRRSSSGR